MNSPGLDAIMTKSSFVVDTTNLPRLEVVVVDSVAQVALAKMKSNPKARTLSPLSAQDCGGTAYMYVGGMDMQTALNTTALFLSSSNACTVIWTGAGDGGVGISVKRSPAPSENGQPRENWSVTMQGPSTSSTWVMGGANTSDQGYPLAPQLQPSGAGFDNATALEEQMLSTLNLDQQARYVNNRILAEGTLRNLTLSECGQIIDDDGGTANAFKHAYWTALNARSLGPELVMRLVSAHEAAGNNMLLDVNMDHFNDMVGLTVARSYPNYNEVQLASIIKQRIVTGHGRRINWLTLNLQTTGMNLCD